jgi:hypothetical protein
MRAEGVITGAEFRVDAPTSHANGHGVPANALQIRIDLEAILDADLRDIDTTL